MAGELVEKEEKFDVFDKFNFEKLESLPSLTPSDADIAIAAALKATSEVAALSTYERREILEKVADLMLKEESKLANILVREAGMCIRDAGFEVRRASNILKMYATDALRMAGESQTFDADARGTGRHGYWFRVPVGVVGAVSAFNNPLVLFAHKMGPAFAAGNSVVFKPSSLTPLAAIRVCEMFLDAGIPKGALSVLTGSGRSLVPAIASNPAVRVISFTGGKDTGDAIAKAAGAKKMLMELGSNCPNIVCPVVDLDRVAKNLVGAAYSFQGQNCLHAQRILIHEDVYGEFKEKFIQKVSELKMGDPRSESSDMGPMISEDSAKRVEEWVKEARDRGGKLLFGGHRSGSFFEPTLFEDVPSSAKISCQEVFGPVSILIKFANIKEACSISNDSDYGLQAGIFTHKMENVLYAIRTLQFGTIMVNESSDFRVDMMPFGGFKGSGLGREGARNAIEAMTEIKCVVYNMKELETNID